MERLPMNHRQCRIAILPLSAQLDLQFGATYSPSRGTAKFYFNMFFPYESQL